MPHYKNTNNELFWLDDGVDATEWLSSDCVEITEEETASIRASQAVELTYSQQRAAEYPSIVDQLDTIYHNGIDAWKESIKAIKDKYPKA